MNDIQEISLDSDAMVECHKYLSKFSWTFFPERFTIPFCSLHQRIFDKIDVAYHNAVFNNIPAKVTIAAPRGLGKTSIAMALCARAILFEDFRYIVYVSNSFDSALEQTENLKSELCGNLYIREFFGDIKSSFYEDALDPSFSKKGWVAKNTFIVPRGSGQQVRGKLYRNSRPDLIIVDDLEDTETIDNELIRDKRKKWFYGDLMKCFGLSARNWMMLYIDTVKHQDSLLTSLLDSPSWDSECIDICDDELTSFAPQFISTEELKKEYADAVRDGTEDVFFMERRNISAAPTDRKFSAKMFKYYTESPDNDWNSWEHVVLVDPARRKGARNANTAIAGVSVNIYQRKVRIRDLINKQLNPDEQVAATFDMMKKISARTLGLEVTGGDEYILFPFRNYATEKGIFCDIIELKSPGGLDNEDSKYRRVMSLYPFYSSGAIEHNGSGCCQSLESQLMSLPRPRRWDAMDVVSRIVAMMNEGGRFFTHSEESDKDYEKSYSELTKNERNSWEEDSEIVDYELAL